MKQKHILHWNIHLRCSFLYLSHHLQLHGNVTSYFSSWIVLVWLDNLFQCVPPFDRWIIQNMRILFWVMSPFKKNYLLRENDHRTFDYLIISLHELPSLDIHYHLSSMLAILPSSCTHSSKFHVPIPHYHTELNFLSRTFTVHRNIGHGHEPLLNISNSVIIPPIFPWEVWQYVGKCIKGYRMSERKMQWKSTISNGPAAGAKSMAQNPPTKINGAESPSCGIKKLWKLQYYFLQPTTHIDNRSMAANHPTKINDVKTWIAGLRILEITTTRSRIPHKKRPLWNKNYRKL